MKRDFLTLLSVCEGGVIVPMIQRPYAQGRKNKHCSAVREKFLNDLFHTLTTEEKQELDLNFVYGNRVNKCLELLDGQQRLTSLLLLYWYIAARENQVEVMRLLKRFTYRTRTTATDFCKHLCDDIHNFVERFEFEPPSHVITKQIWFTHAYKCDETVLGMLVMLDEIHNKYQQHRKEAATTLFDKLKKIIFEVEDIAEYPLKDDLFIKMNRRGLPLTPFEIFKAELTDYLEQHIGEEDALLFVNEMDSVWVNIFFDRCNDEWDRDFVNFFLRALVFFYVDKSNDMEASKDAIGKLLNVASSAQSDVIHVDFALCKNAMTVTPTGTEGNVRKFVNFMRTIFNIFANSDNKSFIEKFYNPAWIEVGDKFYYPCKGEMPWRYVVVFAGLVLYIWSSFEEKAPRKLKQHELEELSRWLRIVRNFAWNSRTGNFDDALACIGILSNFINKRPEGQTIIEQFSRYPSPGFSTTRLCALSAEINKAKVIVKFPEWEKAFTDAEDTLSYFDGYIDHLYEYNQDNPCADEFNRRVRIVKDFFSSKYDRILLTRAMFASVDYNYGNNNDLIQDFVLSGASSSEGDFRNTLLRNLMNRYSDGKVICRLFDDIFIKNQSETISPDAFCSLIEKYVDDAVNRVKHDDKLNGKESLRDALVQLYYTNAIYDYCSGKRNCMLQIWYSSWSIGYKGQWRYGRAFFDHMKCKLANRIRSKYNLSIMDYGTERDADITFWIGDAFDIVLSSAKVKKYLRFSLGMPEDAKFINDNGSEEEIGNVPFSKIEEYLNSSECCELFVDKLKEYCHKE